MSKKQNEFIVNELWILAWNASVQRSFLFRPGSSLNEKKYFREKLLEYIQIKIIKKYCKRITTSPHCNNIEQIILHAESIDAGILGEQGFKYGVAQKLLNLSLKYYWCLGKIQEPPHCPVDRIILKKSDYIGTLNWTKIINRDEYLELIAHIRKAAKTKGKSIAQYELYEFKRR